MAIDPRLVSIKKVADIPTVPLSELQTGQMFGYTGDGDLKKVATNDLLGFIKSGIKGTATQSNAPTAYDAVTYPDGLFETYVVRTPLTLPNSWGSEVTQAELDNNYVFFDVKNGVVSKSLSLKNEVNGLVEEGNTHAVSGGEVFDAIEYKNFGIQKIVSNGKINGSLYLTVLTNANGAIRIDWFDNKVDNYTTSNGKYFYGTAITENQKKGIEPIKLNSQYTHIIIDVYIDFQKDYLGNSELLNSSRFIDLDLVQFNELPFIDTFINANFEANTVLKRNILSNSLIDISLSNDYDAKIYLKSLFINKTTRIARFRFNDANGSGLGVDRALLDLNIDLTTGEIASGFVENTYIPNNIYYKLSVTIKTNLFIDFIERTLQDFDFYEATIATNEIKYLSNGNYLIKRDGDILKHKGYIVANGNTLTTVADNQRFSDYIPLCDKDIIKILSSNNNQVNAIYDFVICICTYDKNLQLVNRLVGIDAYNFIHTANENEKYIRLSCSIGGVSTFRFLIERQKNVYVENPKTLHSLKTVGSNESILIGNENYSKSNNTKVSFSSNKLPTLSELQATEIAINFKITTQDGVYSDYTIDKGTLQWIDTNDTLYFTNNIGYNASTGQSDRTIIFYSKDYCETFDLLYDSGAGIQLVKDWETMCLFVGETGNIMFTRSENVSGVSLVQQTLWCIKGWKNGTIINGKDNDNNTVTISRKFKFSFDSWVAEGRPDLDFAQYGQTTWPGYGIPLGSTQAGRGRMLSGWTYNVYENIVMVTEYGEGDSYWTYMNKLKDVVVSGVHSITDKTNGLGISSKAWVSLDGGDTFKLCFDVHQKTSDGRWKYCGDAENTHLHAINFNPYNEKFYIVNGDLPRAENIAGFEPWMKPNQRIISLSMEDMQKWYDVANVINPDITPSLNNYTDSLPEWNVKKLHSWYDKGFGYEYFLQFGTIEPFPNSTLFSTDSDKNVGFFRLTEDNLDFAIDTRLKPIDKSVSRSHFGGNQQYLRQGMPRIISVATHHAQTKSYIFSCEDGENWKLIFDDKEGIMDWGLMAIPTKKGIFLRPSLTSNKVYLLKNNVNY